MDSLGSWKEITFKAFSNIAIWYLASTNSVQTIRICTMWRGKRAISIPSTYIECGRLFLFHEHLSNDKWVEKTLDIFCVFANNLPIWNRFDYRVTVSSCDIPVKEIRTSYHYCKCLGCDIRNYVWNATSDYSTQLSWVCFSCKFCGNWHLKQLQLRNSLKKLKWQNTFLCSIKIWAFWQHFALVMIILVHHLNGWSSTYWFGMKSPVTRSSE